jgi:hypothetical protein
VEVVPLVDDLFGSGATRRDALRVGRASSTDNKRSWSNKVNCAAADVERVRDATHSAVALNSAAAA